MAKKKKKTKLTEHQQREIQTAQHQKAFTKRLFELLKSLGFGEEISLLTAKDIQVLYITRTVFVKVDDSQAPLLNTKRQKKWIHDMLYRNARSMTVPFTTDEGDKRVINIVDYHEVWSHFTWYVRNRATAEDITPKQKELDRRLRKYAEIVDDNSEVVQLWGRVKKAFEDELLQLSILFSSPTICYITFELGEETQKEDSIGFTRILHVKTHAPEIKKIVIDGEVRRVFKLYKPMGGVIIPAIRKVPYNPYKNVNEEKEYEVYMLEHAMNRLIERLDCVHPIFAMYLLNMSLGLWRVDWFKDTLLIDFYLLPHKVGYLAGKLVGDKIVIRTFLFLTFNGTPEGAALNSYTGLQKLDKDYLNIDKLSAFVASDVSPNSTLGKLLRDTGCEQLIGLKLPSDLMDPDAQLHHVSEDYMEKYLKGADRDF